MAEEILYVESRRAARGKRVQTAQHVFAAILLGAAGFSHVEYQLRRDEIDFGGCALELGDIVDRESA